MCVTIIEGGNTGDFDDICRLQLFNSLWIGEMRTSKIITAQIQMIQICWKAASTGGLEPRNTSVEIISVYIAIYFLVTAEFFKHAILRKKN